ncbi:hypothetical protein GX586_11855 [bacterium]|nr:hypothetical protein [bacterium]
MNRKQSHGALIVMLAPAGTHVKPFCTAFVAALRKRYHTVRAFSGANMLAAARADVRAVRAGVELAAMPRPVQPAASLADTRAAHQALRDVLDAACAHDVFICGDSVAMQLAARLALWGREAALPFRWIGVPCCPFNSVAFTDHSIGFGPALNWCADTARELLSARAADAHRAPVAILEIAGDRVGWLTAGAAALAAPHTQAIALLPDASVDSAVLAAEVKRSIGAHGTALIVSAATGRAPDRARIAAMLGQQLHLEAACAQVCPGEMFDEAHCAARCAREHSRAGTAAARPRAARANGMMLIAQRASAGAYSLSYSFIPIGEAVNTPRRVPEQFVRQRHYRVAPGLSAYLEPLVS